MRIAGLCRVKEVRFSWLPHRLTLKYDPPIYHWLWFNFYMDNKGDFPLACMITSTFLTAITLILHMHWFYVLFAFCSVLIDVWVYRKETHVPIRTR